MGVKSHQGFVLSCQVFVFSQEGKEEAGPFGNSPALLPSSCLCLTGSLFNSYSLIDPM